MATEQLLGIVIFLSYILGIFTTIVVEHWFLAWLTAKFKKVNPFSKNKGCEECGSTRRHRKNCSKRKGK